MSVVQGRACSSGAVSCHYYLSSGKEVKVWNSMSLVSVSGLGVPLVTQAASCRGWGKKESLENSSGHLTQILLRPEPSCPRSMFAVAGMLTMLPEITLYCFFKSSRCQELKDCLTLCYLWI